MASFAARILYLKDILTATTPAAPLGAAEILARLSSLGIDIERKSLYRDIEALREYGMDIHLKRGAGGGYHTASRQFELSELKLLVDAVQSSKFITARKSEELIRKVASLAGERGAETLKRGVYVANRIKSMDDSVLSNVDKINEAMTAGRMITFRYFEWAVDFGGGDKFKRRFRRDGARYTASPWELIWDDENYYMVAYQSSTDDSRHYRVDKMDSITVTDELRDGRREFERFDPAMYSREVFGMFHGERTRARIRFENRFAGVVADRLGRDVFVSPDGREHFIVTADIAASPQFYAWLVGLEGGAEILTPEGMRREMRALLEKALCKT